MVWGKFSVTFPFPRSWRLKTKVSLWFSLAITWLLEGLSKQSFGFVNSEGYLAIEASRWRLSQTVLPGKLFFPKKRPKTAFFGGDESGVSWLWEELYAKLLGLGQLLGYPWKVWGITVQTSYWEGLWHQNCGYTSPLLFFWRRHIESRPLGEKVGWSLITRQSAGHFPWASALFASPFSFCSVRTFSTQWDFVFTLAENYTEERLELGNIYLIYLVSP